MIKSYIKAIDYYLPQIRDYNDENDRLTQKIGIHVKNIAAHDEYASDLAYKAASKLFLTNVCSLSDVDFLIYCTQSPDYYLPTTACMLQERLGLSTSCGALDINLGCSGYIYGLSLAKGLIESGMAKNILFLTADTYSKYINPKDRSVQLLFGDAATATLISSTEECDEDMIGCFVFGTDGKGAENLIVPAGGLREPLTSDSYKDITDDLGNTRNRSNLYMNGSEIFNFALSQVPKSIAVLLEKNNQILSDYDYFVFHQANKYMLEAIRRKMGISKEKFSVQLEDCGNTVSSSIPIAIIRDYQERRITNGAKVMLAGFGVGYSWAACSIKINLSTKSEVQENDE